MKEMVWLKDFARDFIALGSFPAIFVVFIRVWLLDNLYYFSQFFLATLIFFPFIFLFKANRHAGIALIIIIFTTIYYKINLMYTTFSFLAYVLLLFSLFYLKKGKKEIIKGVLFGGVSSLISYYVLWYAFYYL